MSPQAHVLNTWSEAGGVWEGWRTFKKWSLLEEITLSQWPLIFTIQVPPPPLLPAQVITLPCLLSHLHRGEKMYPAPWNVSQDNPFLP